jgi:hypothetical protein
MAAISRLSTEKDDMLSEYAESCVFLAASNSHCYYLSNFPKRLAIQTNKVVSRLSADDFGWRDACDVRLENLSMQYPGL